MRIAYDLSAFLWRAMFAGKDGENGFEVMHNDKPKWINSGNWGYTKGLDMMLEVLDCYGATPIDCILVVEGFSSKAKRLLIYPDYKGVSDKAPEMYGEFEKAKDLMVSTWLSLGACVMEQPYCEGDDTLAWLARETEEPLVIATYDNDLAACNGKNAYGAETEVWVNGLKGVNKYGAFDYHLITAYKALVGDSSDNIKGCKGFGPGTFDKFVAAYGYDGLQEFYDMCKAGSLGPLHAMDDKIIKLICSQEEDVLRYFEVALLRPEWVNTMQHPITVRRGIVEYPPEHPDDRLLKWYGKVWLITAATFDGAVEFFRKHLRYSPYVTLDIEASTPDESDDWCERAKVAVDVFGSELTGLSLTFGNNNQYTMYFSVDHADTDNVPKAKIKALIEEIGLTGKELVVQNVAYETPVLYNSLGAFYADSAL